MENIIKQTWWDKNLINRLDEFKGWIGDSSAESKKFFRDYIKNNNLLFKSMLDVGCGVCTEYYSFKNDNIDINYTGVDSSEFLYLFNKEKNI